MRTLKKSLSLVLVLAMVCSCFVMGTSAAFEDADEITAKYAEAIDVMNALKILQGSDGEFNPQGTLTRAQAARIIVAMLQAEDYAKVATCTFTDVATTDWFYDEIAYCQSIGLMKGYGDGTVGPNDELTGAAFALMLMKAIGVDTSSVNPATYALDTVTLASKLGLATVAELTAEPFTREIASALAFEGLQHGETTVLGYAVVEDATSMVLGYYDSYAEALVAAKTLGAGYTASTEVSKTTTGTLAEKFLLAPASFVDHDGVQYNVWTVDGEAITEPTLANTLVATYAEGTKYSAIVKELGLSAVSKAVFSEKTNGAATTTLSTIAGSSNAKDLYINALSDTYKNVAIPANTTLDVYKTATGNFVFIYTVETTATVSQAAKAEGETSAYAGLYAYTFTCATTDEFVVYAADGTYDDEALYLVALNNGATKATTPALYIKGAEVVTGKVTAMDNAKTYAVVNGTKYVGLTGVLAGISVGKDVAFCLNSNGYVVAAKVVTEEVAETVVFVIDHYVTVTEEVLNNYGLVKITYNVYAQCVDVNGEEVAYLVATDNAELNPAATTYTNNEGVMKAVSYDAANKVYTFSAPTTAAVITVDDQKVAYTNDGVNYYYNNAEFIAISADDEDLSKLKVGAGSAAAAEVNTAWAVFTTNPLDPTNKTVVKVFYLADNEAEVAYDGEIIYLVSTDCEVTMGTNVLGATVPVYTYTVYVDGAETKITTEAEYGVNWYIYSVNAAGHYVLVPVTDEVSIAAPEAITNVYGKYVTSTTLNNYDVTNVTVVDLRLGGDGKLEKGDTITFTYSTVAGKLVVDLIYIVG